MLWAGLFIAALLGVSSAFPLAPRAFGSATAPTQMSVDGAARRGAADRGAFSVERWAGPAAKTRAKLLQQAAAAVLGSGLLLSPAASNAATAQKSLGSDRDVEAVRATTELWLRTVTSGKPTAPQDTAKLYAPDAMLWGTVSSELRDEPLEIESYFDYFARLKDLRVSEYKPLVRVYRRGAGEPFAVNSGYYTFTFSDPDGEEHVKHARFSFTYRKDPSMPTGWAIVDHHSSAVPASPAELQHAN